MKVQSLQPTAANVVRRDGVQRPVQGDNSVQTQGLRDAVEKVNSFQEEKAKNIVADIKKEDKAVQKEQQATREEVKKSLEKVQKSVDIFNRRIHFQMHDESDKWLVQVIDTETDKVLKEIPPEKWLKLVVAIQEATGLLFDERV